MEVIVTGAASFIGRRVTAELARRGCEVIAVVRPASPGRAVLEGMERVRITECGLEEIGTLAKKLAAAPAPDARAWLHLGWDGAGSANRQNPQLQAKNIGYALRSLETAAALGCGRFLFGGSQAEYGICAGPMREEMECRPVSEYGKDKLAVCLRAQELAARLGLTYLHTRIFSVYGPGDHPWSLISTCIETFARGGHMEMGPCTQLWNFLYVEDAARLLAQLLLGKAPAGVYNVAGEDTRPLRAYIEELYALCGRRGTYEFGTRPPNAEGVVSLQPDLRRLKAAVGPWRQTTFAEGIRFLLNQTEGENAT